MKRKTSNNHNNNNNLFLLILNFCIWCFLFVFYSIWNTILWCIPDAIFKITNNKKIIDSNDIVLITGAGHGIGKAIAKKLAKLDATLVLWDINETTNSETLKEILVDGGKAHAFRCDISKKDDVYRVAEQVRQTVGDVTILINNAGILIGKRFLDLTDTDIERVVNINAVAHFWTTRAFLKPMVERNKGHIVTMASAAGFFGVNKLVDYSASKHFVLGFVDALRNELEHNNLYGIKFTTVCPTWTNTGMCDGVTSHEPILDANYVADCVVKGMLSEQEMVLIPSYMKIILAITALSPYQANKYLIHRVFKANHSMDTFTGNLKKKE